MFEYLNYLPHLGWVAMMLTLISTFARTIIRLRTFSAASNVVQIVAASAAGYWPGAVQNAIQLPINFWRIREMQRLIEQIKSASAKGGADGAWLSSIGTASRIAVGEVLFRRDDPGDRLYYVVSGRIRFPEIDVSIGAGTMFGEIAFFTHDGLRTQSAVAETECELLSIGGDQLKQLYFQNPEFGWYLVRLIAQRLIENAERARPETRASATTCTAEA
jgi:CRP/FNR family transcriptional regulator, cyclic AMP receptor protein